MHLEIPTYLKITLFKFERRTDGQTYWRTGRLSDSRIDG